MKKTNSIKKFSVLLASALIIIILLELSLRLIWGFGDNLLFKTHQAYEYELKPLQNCRRFGNSLITNEYGMRSQPLRPGSIKILGFGDSVINGGVLTSHEELATSLLSNGLSAALKNDVQFLNISAPSWEPDNAFAFLQTHGHFDADMFMLFVNHKDAFDSMTFEPVVGIHPAFPSNNYTSALIELIHRYLFPRLKAFLKGKTFSHDAWNTSPEQNASFNSGFNNFFHYCNQNNIPLVIYLLPSSDEILAQKLNDGSSHIREFAKSKHITLIEGIHEEFSQEHFRDMLHLNASGQKHLALSVFNFLSKHQQ